MKPESIVLAIAGMFFGLLVGWVIGTQQGSPRLPQPAGVAAAPSPAPQGGAQQAAAPAPAPVDESRAQALRNAAQQNSNDVQSRVELGNMYFDAGRYQDAVGWYDQAVKLAPKDVNVSTDLGVTYYYLNQPDRALQQFEHSLSVDPKHAKTLLNQGIVRAFGKRDLKGAVASWQRLTEVAPNSPEAGTARKALENLKSAHPDLGGGGPTGNQ